MLNVITDYVHVYKITVEIRTSRADQNAQAVKSVQGIKPASGINAATHAPECAGKIPSATL